MRDEIETKQSVCVRERDREREEKPFKNSLKKSDAVEVFCS